MKENKKIKWSEIVLFIIGILFAAYRITADIISFAGLQLELLNYDPGTAEYAEKAAGLPFPLIDGGICLLFLIAIAVVFIIALVTAFSKKPATTGETPRKPYPWMKTTNADAPVSSGIRLSNVDGSSSPVVICSQCGARLFRYPDKTDEDTENKE